MSDQMKKCIGCCDLKPHSEYWKGRGKYLQGRCKPCHVAFRKQYAFNRKPRPKKLRGFAALPEETRNSILEMINGDEKVKKKEIAEKFGINPQTFYYWCRRDLIK